MAFVLNTCCQSKICPIVGMFGGTISLNRVFGAAWISKIFILSYFSPLTLILRLSIKTCIPVVWALEQF